MKSIHSGRLERWVGAQRLKELSNANRGWYGPPIPLLDVPGSVKVCGDGDFIGTFDRGYFASAADSLFEFNRRLTRHRHGIVGAGFTSVADALSKLTRYDGVILSLNKGGSSSAVAGASSSYWYTSGAPAPALTSPLSSAPAGEAPTSSTLGTWAYTNPNSGTLHLLGTDFGSAVTSSLMIYDRLFHVGKTMNSTATEAVTGVPTRYQSTTGTAADFAGGNFAFVETATTLPNTTHNWTVCQYTNQAGTTGQSFPSMAGINSCAAPRLDMLANNWFLPLAAGDTGVAAISQMQCDALVASGSVVFVIGHPIGWATVGLANSVTPYDWITNRNQAPRIFDNACLAVLQAPGLGSAVVATGTITLVRADP